MFSLQFYFYFNKNNVTLKRAVFNLPNNVTLANIHQNSLANYEINPHHSTFMVVHQKINNWLELLVNVYLLLNASGNS